LVKYNSEIEIGLVCWNFIQNFTSLEAFTLEDVMQLCSNIKCGILLNEESKQAFLNVKFYFPGESKQHWEKLHIFSIRFKPEKLLVYQDIFMFDKYDVSCIDCKKYLLLPVHSAYLPHTLLQFDNGINSECLTLKQLPFFDKIATFSKFGVEVLKLFGHESSFIDHIIDSNFFYNMNCKNETRLKYNLSETDYICLMVARNSEPSERKAYIQQLNAFAIFAKDKPNAKLLIHNNYRGNNPGIDMDVVISNLDICKNVIKTDNTINANEHIRDLYQMADVLLCASKSEGFGLPMVEAQFCELLVISTNCTAMADNTYFGICTEPESISHTVNGINGWCNPSVNNIVTALNDIYNNELSKYNIKPIDKIRYDKSTIVKEWVNFLELD
jgi:glycosyltransferase involved in cell wall biosynthesis